jgi:hypothetical protein
MTPDRRRFERVPFFTALTLSFMRGRPYVEGRTIDVSLGDVGLSCPEALSPGSFVSLAFRLRLRSHGEVVEQLIGRITRARSDEAGTTLVVKIIKTPNERSPPVLVRRSGQR